MTPVVVDASIVVEYLLRTPRGRPLEALLREGDADLHVPALCDVEVTSVVRRAVRERRLGGQRAEDALEDYLDLPLARHGHTYLLSRILGLGGNLSAYDATYVALAEWLGARLLTSDERMARAAREHSDVRFGPPEPEPT